MLSLKCLVLIYEFTYIISEHVDGNNSDRWDNTVHVRMHTVYIQLQLLVKVASKCCNYKVTVNIVLKVQMLQISYNIDVVILVALI